MVEECKEKTVNKMDNRKLHAALLDPYNNSLSLGLKCSENRLFLILSSATDHIGSCSLPVMRKRDQILSTASISTAAAAAVPRRWKPYSFLIHHCVVAKAIKRVGQGCTTLSPEKPHLPFLQLQASNELILVGE